MHTVRYLAKTRQDIMAKRNWPPRPTLCNALVDFYPMSNVLRVIYNVPYDIDDLYFRKRQMAPTKRNLKESRR
jgi:hypothetical protein